MLYSMLDSIKEVSTTVLQPIAEQTLRYIISRLGYTNIFGSNLIFEGFNETVTKMTDDNENRSLADNKVICAVTNILSPTETPFDALNTSHITSEGWVLGKITENYPLLSDHKNKFFLYEINRPCSIQLECRFNFKDNVIASEFGARMFTIFSNGMTIPVVDLMYDYPIPENILMAFYRLFKLTQIAENPNNKFIPYLKDASNHHVAVNQNKLISSKRQLIIQKTLKYALIKIDFTDPNIDAEKKNKSPIKFANQMTITVQFSKPSDMVLKYPIMINNQLIPYDLVPQHAISPQPPLLVHPEMPINNFFKYVNACNIDWCLQFWDKRELEDIQSKDEYIAKLKEAWTHAKDTWYVRIPEYDNWQPPALPRWPKSSYNPIVIFIVTTDIVNNEIRLHLYNEVRPATGVSLPVIDYIKSHGNDIFYEGLQFLVAVYRDANQLDQSQLSIEGDYLVIKTKKHHAIHRVAIYTQVYKSGPIMKPTFGVGIFDIVVNKEGK